MGIDRDPEVSVLKQREYIEAENRAYKMLVKNGYTPQGADAGFKTVCIMKFEHPEFVGNPKNFQEAAERLIKGEKMEAKYLIKKIPQNRYLLSFFRHKGLKIGDSYSPCEYMSWIDCKHDEFRKLHGLSEHISLTDEEVEEFVMFLNCGIAQRRKKYGKS